ncbi:MAG TPA: hypothetical protein ACQGQI_05645 [Xylella sp.]
MTEPHEKTSQSIRKHEPPPAHAHIKSQKQKKQHAVIADTAHKAQHPERHPTFQDNVTEKKSLPQHPLNNNQHLSESQHDYWGKKILLIFKLHE